MCCHAYILWNIEDKGAEGYLFSHVPTTGEAGDMKTVCGVSTAFTVMVVCRSKLEENTEERPMKTN